MSQWRGLWAFFSKAILRASCDVRMQTGLRHHEMKSHKCFWRTNFRLMAVLGWMASWIRMKRRGTPCLDDLRTSRKPERFGTKTPSRKSLLARHHNLATSDF